MMRPHHDLSRRRKAGSPSSTDTVRRPEYPQDSLVHAFINTMMYFYCHMFLMPPCCLPQTGCSLCQRTSPFEIKLSRKERVVLQHRAAKYTSPYCEVVRAKIILLAAEGTQNKHIAQCLSLPSQIVCRWRKRFFEERLAGLDERPRRGRPRLFSPS